MKIVVEVPDDTTAVEVISCHYTQRIPYQEIRKSEMYFGQQLQAMKVKEPQFDKAKLLEWIDKNMFTYMDETDSQIDRCGVNTIALRKAINNGEFEKGKEE